MSAKVEEKKEQKTSEKEVILKKVESFKPTEEAKKEENLIASKMNQNEELKPQIILSAEQRLKSLQQMNILGEKFNFLKTKEDELNKFVLSSDGTKEKISLSNASGFKFEVSNSQTIEKVLLVISEDLKIFTNKAEEEILNFKV